MTQQDPLLAGTVRLTDAVRGLSEQVVELGEAIDAERARGQRYRRVLVAVVVSLVLGFAGLGGVWYVQAERTRLVDRVLCPLYALFLGSYAPESRPPGEARDRYVAAFGTIREGYRELRCIETQPVVPPPRR